MGVGFVNTCTVSVVEMRVPSRALPTQLALNRWLLLRSQSRGLDPSLYLEFISAQVIYI